MKKLLSLIVLLALTSSIYSYAATNNKSERKTINVIKTPNKISKAKKQNVPTAIFVLQCGLEVTADFSCYGCTPEEDVAAYLQELAILNQMLCNYTTPD